MEGDDLRSLFATKPVLKMKLRFLLSYLHAFKLFRDIETPDTIISSSSPECTIFDPPFKYQGLRLIEIAERDVDEDDDKSTSPIIPLFAPIPIRGKLLGLKLILIYPRA